MTKRNPARVVVHRLEYLNLSGNRISCIRIPPTGEVGDSSANTAVFPKLVRLNISENCIADVSFVIFFLVSAHLNSKSAILKLFSL